MSKGTIKENWVGLKDKIQETWPTLTDGDVDMIAGRRDQLIGKIQERQGVTADLADIQVAEWESRLGCAWGN